jgi:2,4-dienoyl-CoA reductase (NADPH2)
MGSEGYFINQFLVNRTNHRTDQWGGSYENRIRLPIEIVKRVRQAVGEKFIIIYRLSMLDLVEDGSSWDEVTLLANHIRDAGATIINTGIGWHEARVPTIATMVPRGAFTWVTKRMRQALNDHPIRTSTTYQDDLPPDLLANQPIRPVTLCTTNRINHPGTAEAILQEGATDMISMARPLLADPYFVLKTMENRVDEINTCIGCNQACLDHIFVSKRASCLVNPLAAHEKDLRILPTVKPQQIAVIGAGPAGLSCALTCLQRGHHVSIYEKDITIGGQFNIAKLIPGKEEFYETIRYFHIHFQKYLQSGQLQLHFNTPISSPQTQLANYNRIVVATGVTPRMINLPNKSTKATPNTPLIASTIASQLPEILVQDLESQGRVKIISYYDLLKYGHLLQDVIGSSVAVIGAGGIGFDVSDYLTHPPHDHHHDQHQQQQTKEEEITGKLSVSPDKQRIETFLQEWHIDPTIQEKGGILKSTSSSASAPAIPRKVYLLQRKSGKLGQTLGKTTGWIHKATLKKRNVTELSSCKYVEINDTGLVVEIENKQQTLPVNSVIICAGQEPCNHLFKDIQQALPRIPVYVIGGAGQAAELDAKRAIDQGTRLAAQIESAHSGEVFNAPVDFSHQLLVWMEKNKLGGLSGSGSGKKKAKKQAAEK